MTDWKSCPLPIDLGVTPVSVAACRCLIGENPLWHSEWNVLLWLDIPRGRVYSYDPVSGNSETLYQGHVTGGFTIQRNGDLLLFQKSGAIRCWSPNSLETIVESLPNEEMGRFNDVFADPKGRIYAGTMSSEPFAGRLYRLDPNGEIHVLEEAIGISNGIGISPDLRWMYHVDSRRGGIFRYAYDVDSGELSERQLWTTFPSDSGVPDGLKVDVEGNIWVAFWGGHQILVLNPLGQVQRDIKFPVAQVASLAASPSGVIFATSAREGLSTNPNTDQDGDLFAFRSDKSFMPLWRSSYPTKYNSSSRMSTTIKV